MSFSHRLEHFKEHIELWRMNMLLTRDLRPARRVQEGEFTFTTASRAQARQAERLHRRLFPLPLLGWLHHLYTFRARELVAVVLDARGRVIAYDFCMFNEAEYKLDFVHELYLGVDPEYQGQGIAGKLRRFTCESFKDSRLKAVSTCVGFDEIKALRSAQKAGFAIIKRSLKPPAHYMVRYLKAPQ